MANIVFNIAKGRVAELARNVDGGSPANSRLLVVPLEASGLEADGTLQDYDTLAALLAASNNEQTTMGRKTLGAANVTVEVDDSGNLTDIDIDDQTWTAATGNAVGALVICYIPDGVTPGADSTAIPLTKHDFSVTPDGSDIVAQINAEGFFRAS